MKSLFSVIFLFLFVNSAFAVIPSANLCDASCNLTISFPTGGSITAVEPLTFTFGDNGLVDTVATSTAYIAGNTLSLAAGESFAFGDGGSLDLGAGGNLAYSNIAITTNGNINIQAVGGIETIYLYTVTLSGTANLVLTGASISVEGTVDAGTDATLSFNATGSTSGCVTTSSDVMLIGSDGTPVVIDTSSDCNTISADIPIIFSSGTITNNNGGTASLGEVTLIDNGGTTISAGDITLNSETQSDSGSLNIVVLLFSFLTLIYLRRFKLN